MECDCIRVAIHVENDTAYRNIVQGADTIIRVYTYNNPFSSRFNLKIKKHEVDKKLTTQGGTQFSMRWAWEYLNFGYLALGLNKQHIFKKVISQKGWCEGQSVLSH